MPRPRAAVDQRLPTAYAPPPDRPILIMHTHHPQLYPARLRKLRPTQMTVGYAEVAAKQVQWQDMRKNARKHFLHNHWLPAVRGPKSNYYIVDHHHLGRALLDQGVEDCHVIVLKDLSHLAPDEFWLQMDQAQWVHPYDAKGRRRPVDELPRTLEDLADDPYRSLAGEVRRAGGFPKDATPFAEFLWADFFRRRIGAGVVRKTPQQALAQALVLCHSPEAAHLPGWSGVAPAPTASATALAAPSA